MTPRKSTPSFWQAHLKGLTLIKIFNSTGRYLVEDCTGHVVVISHEEYESWQSAYLKSQKRKGSDTT